MSAVLAWQMTRPPDPIDFPALGLAGAEAIEAVLLKAMSIHPEDRYQSVAEFKGALEAILTGILSSEHAPGRGAQVTATAPPQPTHMARSSRATITASPSPQWSRRAWVLSAGLLGLGACAGRLAAVRRQAAPATTAATSPVSRP